MRKLLLSFFLLTAAVSANAAGVKTDTLWTSTPYETDVRALLTGQKPGVVVTSSLGAPGMTPSVFIQGYHPGMNEPVYIVDGMRVLHLDTLAPDSIESMTVLPGSKAMTLYGPAAANGALVIKTKSATRNGFHASYGFTGAVHQLAWEPKQISRVEWARYYPKYGDEKYLQSENNTGQLGASFAQTHHLDLQYRKYDKFGAAATFDFLDNDAPFKGRDDAQRRFSGSARIQYKPVYWLRAELSATLGKSDVSRSNALHRILLNYPIDTETKYDPNVGAGERKFKDFTGNAQVIFYPVSGLTLRAHAGYSAQRSDDSFVEMSYLTNLEGTQTIYDWKYFQYGLETTYQRYFGAHSLQANLSLRGQSVSVKEGTLFATARYVPQDNTTWLKFLDGDDPKNYSMTTFAPEKPVRWGDGRIGLTYGYSNLLKIAFDYYLLRSSNGGQDFAYNVPSVQVTWNAGQGLLKKINPSSQIGWNWNVAWSKTNPYSTHRLPVLVMQSIMAQSSRLEVGTDIRVGNLALAASWFQGRDRYEYYIPIDLRNQGWTLSADWIGKSGDFLYGVGLNASLYQNKCLTSMSGALFYLDQNLCASEGNPLGVMWLNAYSGIGTEGTPVYKTFSNGSTRNFFGNGPFPTATLGFHFDLQWRRWTFNLVAHGNFGQSVTRPVNLRTGVLDEPHDLLTRHYMVNSWSEYNVKGQYPRVSPLLQGSDFYLSSAMVHDGSFFRIDQIRLQYRLPVRRLHAHVRLFASLENFFLLTSYPGSDPEYNLSWDNPGFDRGSYPSTRRVVFGVKFDL